MTKAAAIHAFFSQFLTAYEENSVYDTDEPPAFPYLTYQLITGAFEPENNGVSVSVSLWYRSESWLTANAKAEEMAKAIGRHGVLIRCDGGRILIRRSDTNFAQSMGDPSDDRIKRKLLSLTIEYFTND